MVRSRATTPDFAVLTVRDAVAVFGVRVSADVFCRFVVVVVVGARRVAARDVSVVSSATAT